MAYELARSLHDPVKQKRAKMIFNCGHLRQCAEAAGGVARPAPSRLDALKANPRTFPVRVDEFYSGGGQNACNRRHGPSVRLDFVIFEFANGQSCYAGLGR